jgi:DNA-binding transcriptional ArsR family regulator
LIDGVLCSISQLTDDSKMSRQAITKHLRVVESAGLLRGETAGRECLFELQPRPLEEIRDYLDLVSKQWDQTLSRLKKVVETEGWGSQKIPPIGCPRRASFVTSSRESRLLSLCRRETESLATVGAPVCKLAIRLAHRGRASLELQFASPAVGTSAFLAVASGNAGYRAA